MLFAASVRRGGSSARNRLQSASFSRPPSGRSALVHFCAKGQARSDPTGPFMASEPAYESDGVGKQRFATASALPLSTLPVSHSDLFDVGAISHSHDGGASCTDTAIVFMGVSFIVFAPLSARCVTREANNLRLLLEVRSPCAGLYHISAPHSHLAEAAERTASVLRVQSSFPSLTP